MENEDASFANKNCFSHSVTQYFLPYFCGRDCPTMASPQVSDYCLNPAKLARQLLLLYCFFVYLACQNKTLWKSIWRGSLWLKCPIKSLSLKTYLGGSDRGWKNGEGTIFHKDFCGRRPWRSLWWKYYAELTKEHVI